jgi:branched-chain amino acid transport system substrate-binding protein
MKKLTLTLAAASALLVCNLSFAGGTIKIGIAGPQTGDLASYGIPTARAAQLVAKEINASGGLLGKQIELLIEDDVCKPEIATNTATKLVSDGAEVILGHICSGATKAALGIYKDAKKVVISPSATNPPLTQSGEYPNFFRTIAPDNLQSKVAVDFTLGKLGAKKIAIIHDKGDYGRGFADFAKEYVEKAGGAQIVLFEGVNPDAVDYSAIVQKIKKEDAEAVIFGGYHPTASKIVAQMRKKKLSTFFVSDDGVKDDTFIKVAGEFAEGVYATGPKDVSALPLHQKAVKAYKENYKAEKGAFFIEGYSAMLALVNAIKKAGSTDYAAVEKVLRSDYVDTPLGKISFDQKGDAIGVGFSVYKVEKGVYVEQK